MLIAQITDCHIGAREFSGLAELRAESNLRRCIEHIQSLAVLPDAVLATGDLVNSGTDDEFALFRACLEPLTMPVYMIPGNHDDRAALRRAFPDHDYIPGDSGRMRYVLELAGLRLICLDTLIPGETHGRLGSTQLAWLGDRLDDDPGAPTIIVMHHPPFDIGVHRMDRIKCEDGEALATVLAMRPRVERILCGHAHRYAMVDFAGTVGIAAPSTAAQIALDLSDGVRTGWSDEPPAYLLHQWRPAKGVTTHLCQVAGSP